MFDKIKRLFSLYRKESIFLLFLVGLNSLLRFYRLAAKGLWHSDEIVYYMVCHDVINSFRNTFSSSQGILKGLFATLQILTQFPPKFGFYLTNSIAWSLFDYPSTTLFVSAIFSILTIVVVFIIGRKFFSFRTGVMASILFSFSLIYLRWSRTGFAYAPTYFWLVLGIYFYLNYLKTSARRDLLFTGLMLSIGTLFHSQVMQFVLILALAEAIRLFFIERNFSRFRRRAKIMSFSFLLPFIVLEIPILIGRGFGWYTAQDYFTQIYNTMSVNIASRQSLTIYPSFYLWVLWILESPLIFLLCVLSLVSSFKKAKMHFREENYYPELLIALLFLLPYGYWLFQDKFHQVDYNVLGAWPFLFLFVALGLEEWLRKFKMGRVKNILLLILVILVTLSYSLYHLRTFYRIKSHFPEVSQVLREHKIDKIIVYRYGGLWTYRYIDPYLKNIQFFNADTNQEVYKIARKEGVNYCFYGSYEFCQAKLKDAVVKGELVAKIKDTTMRPHYPLLYYGLICNRIFPGAAETYQKYMKDETYDYMYLYQIGDRE